MKIGELLNRIEHISVDGGSDCVVDGLACDSRYVRAGYLFVAISGYQLDGWNFVGGAIERGATVILKISETSTKEKINDSIFFNDLFIFHSQSYLPQ